MNSECNGNCNQGRTCNCDPYKEDAKVSYVLALIFVVMFVVGLIMEKFYA